MAEHTGRPAARQPRPLRILLTNDDGIHAPGLKVLHRIARHLSNDLWIVAPETEQSGASHSLTLTVPLRVRRIGPRRFAIQGTPGDSVMMAVKSILDRPPDLVLSGVNRGANLADDVTYSGTIAAAMEGTLLGIPSVALSQAYGPTGEVPWGAAERHGPVVLKRLLETGWATNVLMNVNFPDRPPEAVAGIQVTGQGQRDQSNVIIDQRIDARGNQYYWIGFARVPSNPPEGTDLKAIYSGRISITPLHMNLTARDAFAALESAFPNGAAVESECASAQNATDRHDG